MSNEQKNLMVAFEDGTYGSIFDAVIIEVPDEVLGEEAELVETWICENIDESEPVVLYTDVLDSVRLAMEGDGLKDYADAVIVTVEDAIANNCC